MQSSIVCFCTTRRSKVDGRGWARSGPGRWGGRHGHRSEQQMREAVGERNFTEKGQSVRRNPAPYEIWKCQPLMSAANFERPPVHSLSKSSFSRTRTFQTHPLEASCRSLAAQFGSSIRPSRCYMRRRTPKSRDFSQSQFILLSWSENASKHRARQNLGNLQQGIVE